MHATKVIPEAGDNDNGPRDNPDHQGGTSEKTGRIGGGGSSDDLPPATLSGRSVLKPQSSFSGVKLGPENGEAGKRLTFADEHGEVLVINVFTDQLHYGQQTAMGALGSPGAAKCCTVS
jgi:hypothetical protein